MNHAESNRPAPGLRRGHDHARRDCLQVSAAVRKAERFEFVGALFYMELGLTAIVSRFVPPDSLFGWIVLVTFGTSTLLTMLVWIRLIRNRKPPP